MNVIHLWELKKKYYNELMYKIIMGIATKSGCKNKGIGIAFHE